MDGVPNKVYTEFIEALKKAGVSNDVVARLEDTFTKDVNLSEGEIRKALFGDEDTDL